GSISRHYPDVRLQLRALWLGTVQRAIDVALAVSGVVRGDGHGLWRQWPDQLRSAQPAKSAGHRPGNRIEPVDTGHGRIQRHRTGVHSEQQPAPSSDPDHRPDRQHHRQSGEHTQQSSQCADTHPRLYWRVHRLRAALGLDLLRRARRIAGRPERCQQRLQWHPVHARRQPAAGDDEPVPGGELQHRPARGIPFSQL
ncbi:Microcystin dependent protein, partial [Pseudomonas sp. FEN]